MTNLSTKETITWCPGCASFVIKSALEQALEELIKEGYRQEEFVMVTDIGCSSKIYDYINISGINGLHGRVLPVMFGIKNANPKMKVLGIAGDGGTYDEGISHFIHSCRYNQDANFFVLDNQIFALTVGQATATTEENFIEKTHPKGVKEKPLNPIVLAIESGASFVARVSALDLQGMKEIFIQAVKHKGFSFVEILQPCLKFHNTTEILKKNTYKIAKMEKESALKEAKKWDYTKEGKIPVGIFLQENREIFEEKYGLVKRS